MKPEFLKDLCIKGGLIGLLAFALVTGQQGYWYFGNAYNEVKADRDAWKALAVKGANLALNQPRQLRAPGFDRKVSLPGDSTLKDVQQVLAEIQSIHNGP